MPPPEPHAKTPTHTREDFEGQASARGARPDKVPPTMPRPAVRGSLRRGPLQRRLACGRVRRLARRAGRLDERGALGAETLGALRSVRALALAQGCLHEDVDVATMEGVVDGRARA